MQRSGPASAGAPKSPDAFRTIGEVSEALAVPQHVLRFWESKFPQIRPLKRGGGRRYYRPEDVALLRHIQHLLHAEGYTVRGCRSCCASGRRDPPPQQRYPIRSRRGAPSTPKTAPRLPHPRRALYATRLAARPLDGLTLPPTSEPDFSPPTRLGAPSRITISFQ